MSDVPAISASGLPGKRVEAHRAGIRMTAFMDAVHGISAADRRLARQLIVALVAILAAVATVDRLALFYSHKFFDRTGRAQWIWPKQDLSLEMPVAFFATRDFDLPPNRQFTRIKIAGDPEYLLWFNGVQIGGRRSGEGSVLDVYDVSKLARDKGNRIVAGVRSANGVGGLIASVDVTDEYKNMVPTGPQWHIFRRWNQDLPLHDPAHSKPAAMTLIGRPPIGRWNYLTPAEGHFLPPARRLVLPRSSFHLKTALPEIVVLSGVPVVVSKPAAATVFDFGPTEGRARLTIDYDTGVSRKALVRFANDASELGNIEAPVEAFVFAAGERTIIDPQERNFRYAIVYGSQTAVSVVQ